MTPVCRLRLSGHSLIEILLALSLFAGPFTAPAWAEDVPLIRATLENRAADVRALLADGADPDAHDRHRNTALIFAARDGRTDIARLLIEHGASVDWQDGELVTPLILAAFKGHVAIARMLVERGADRAIRDQWERTALDYARRRGTDDEIYRLLLGAAD